MRSRMINAAGFAKSLQKLVEGVSTHLDVTDEQLRQVVKGTHLTATTRVMWAIRWAIYFAKSNKIVVDGRVVRASPEQIESSRGRFFYVWLAGAVYRAAFRAAETDYRLAHPPVPPQSEDLSDLDTVFMDVEVVT